MVANRLDEVAQILDQQGANVFRVGAYRRAGKMLRGLHEPIDQIVKKEGLERLPGIGETLARFIHQLVMTGRVQMLDRLRGESDPIGLLPRRSQQSRVLGFNSKIVIKLVAFAKRPPHVRTVIMIARDPRGDYLAMLCRMVGLGVVRGDSESGGREALHQMVNELTNGACVILTADGGGPARIAKVGAVALASSVGAPLVPLAADCHPAIEERHKWDAARNPLPFGNLLVLLGPPLHLEPLMDWRSIEEARSRLEVALNRSHLDAVAAVRSS